MEFYQWLVPIVSLYFSIRIIRQFRQRKRLLGSTVIWILFWITVSLLAIVPDLVSFNVAKLLGFKSNINAVIFVALGFLFVFMFYLTAIVEKLEKQFTELVRQLAIENQKLKEELGKADIKNNEDTPGS